MASWREAVEWTGAAPAFARDRLLSSYEPANEPCDEFHLLASRIVRTLELCRQRLESPGAYRGVGETECDAYAVIPNGVQALRAGLLHGRSSDPLVWEGLGEAFVLSDDDEDAKSAFVIAAHLFRIIGFDEDTPSLLVIQEGWRREREEILMARAWIQIHRWNDEPISDELGAKSRAPWPDQPPPKKPRHRRAQQ